MDKAKELFAAGKLNEAIEELVREVKANPNDGATRTFLFELSCLAGDWERAERQLGTAQGCGHCDFLGQLRSAEDGDRRTGGIRGAGSVNDMIQV